MEPPYRLAETDLLAACQVEAFRSRGPGGQHVNRTESAVRLTHRASGVQVQCQDHRERGRNLTEALRHLRLRLACQIRGGTQVEWATPWLRNGRFLIGAQASAYAEVVAVALDNLADQQGDLALAAARLGSSSSQLAKLLSADKEVHQAANAVRAVHGKGTIRG